jgi:hypothetical protein
VVIFRPRLALRLAGPIVVVAGLALVATGAVAGIVVVLLGLAISVVWLLRVEVGPDTVSARGVTGTIVIPIAAVREVRLRRVPFGPPRPPHRSYRIGRLSTTPIRLRLVAEGEMIQLTVAMWDHWPALVRIFLNVPGVESDARTRGRLDRYG